MRATSYLVLSQERARLFRESSDYICAAQHRELCPDSPSHSSIPLLLTCCRLWTTATGSEGGRGAAFIWVCTSCSTPSSGSSACQVQRQAHQWANPSHAGLISTLYLPLHGAVPASHRHCPFVSQMFWHEECSCFPKRGGDSCISNCVFKTPFSLPALKRPQWRLIWLRLASQIERKMIWRGRASLVLGSLAEESWLWNYVNHNVS